MGIVWPAVPDPVPAQVLALLHQLEQSERWPASHVEALQFRQLSSLLRHACAAVPLYRDRAAEYAGFLETPTWAAWRRLPLLTRAAAQAAGASLAGPEPTHGVSVPIRTSGSTGTPVEAATTPLAALFATARVLRSHLWHGRDFGATAAVIRNFPPGVALPPDGDQGPGWGLVFESGPQLRLSVRATVDQQLEWLARVRPTYLWSFPTNVTALARRSMERGIGLPTLRQVGTLGEVLDPRTRALARQAWDVEIVDIYSAEEVGPIAIQCSEQEHYHVQSESLLVEVLDSAGRPCAPGEVGRVVVTDLHNFATPLVRYDLGDYAEVGGACPCGRTLPVLRRVLGRARNMQRLPSGGWRWPTIPSGDELGRLAPVRQFQLVQRAVDEIEARLVTTRPLTDEEAARVRQALARDLEAPVRLVYVDAIPRAPSGKYEDFRSELEPPGGGPAPIRGGAGGGRERRPPPASPARPAASRRA